MFLSLSLMRCAVEVIVTSWRIDTKLETPERSSADLARFCNQMEQLLALGSARRASCLFCNAAAAAADVAEEAKGKELNIGKNGAGSQPFSRSLLLSCLTELHTFTVASIK